MWPASAEATSFDVNSRMFSFEPITVLAPSGFGWVLLWFQFYNFCFNCSTETKVKRFTLYLPAYTSASISCFTRVKQLNSYDAGSVREIGGPTSGHCPDEADRNEAHPGQIRTSGHFLSNRPILNNHSVCHAFFR